MNDVSEYAWRGIDDETRLDVASVEWGRGGGLVATGRQSTEHYRVEWDLVVDEYWRTKLVSIDASSADSTDDHEEPSWSRHMTLWRRDVGGASVWHCEATQSGTAPSDFDNAGITEDQLALLGDAFDVDLQATPMTNTMPVHRLGVASPDTGERDVTVAYVSLPDLAVRPAQQTYSASDSELSRNVTGADNRIASLVHYVSHDRNVSTDLALDERGVVLIYPDLAARIELR